MSVTQPEDYYYIVGNLQYEKPDAAGDGMDTYQALRSEIVETAEGIPLQSPPYTGKAYIQSDDPAEIAAGSDYVVKAKVAESSGRERAERYRMVFLRNYGGVVTNPRGVPPEGKAEIIFPSGAVSPGGEYILLLTYPDNEWPSDLPAPFYIISVQDTDHLPTGRPGCRRNSPRSGAGRVAADRGAPETALPDEKIQWEEGMRWRR